MVAGMFSQYLYDWFTKAAEDKTPFNWRSFLAPALVSPIIFVPLCGTLDSGEHAQKRALMLVLVAFENGFFFKNYFEERAKAAVGISKYAHLRKLDFVENDVDEMLKWLLLEERFDDVYVLRDGDATPRSVSNLMFNFFPGIIRPQDRFLFYYSGHGNDLGTSVGYFVFSNATNSYDQDA
jgi:hypothetical protein